MLVHVPRLTFARHMHDAIICEYMTRSRSPPSTQLTRCVLMMLIHVSCRTHARQVHDAIQSYGYTPLAPGLHYLVWGGYD